MSERNDTKTLHVELPAGEFDRLKDAADDNHRTLKGEVRRLIRDAYRMEENELETPVANQTAAT